MTIRVVLADDEDLVRSGISLLLTMEPDIEVVAEVGDGVSALAAVAEHHPDVVVMDLRMPVMDGVEATKQLIDADPDRSQFHANRASVLALTTFRADELVFAALRAGASGFLLKDAAPTELIAAVRALAAGQGWIDPSVTRPLIEEFKQSSDVTAGKGLLQNQTSPSPGSKDDPAFRLEGEYWTINFNGTVARLKDSAGLRHLVWLLRYPGREFHSLELAGTRSVGHAASRLRHDQPLSLEGTMRDGIIDGAAKKAYSARLLELEEELQEAEDWADSERYSHLLSEIQALQAELARGFGLGGRQRTGASSAERARVSVTKAIRTAIRRIDKALPALGRHLESSIRTGHFCSYQPEDRILKWHL